jgi:hypothetical protein
MGEHDELTEDAERAYREAHVITPKFVKDRLIRIETRLVKYQESNVVIMDAVIKSIDSLANTLEKLIIEVEDLSGRDDEFIPITELEVLDGE